MKAYIIKNPRQGIQAWEQATMPDPKPGRGEVLIAVKAASLNYRDLMIAKGLYPLPILENVIPLSDGAGEIIAVGEGVTRWKTGDRVCGSFFQTWTDGAIPQDAQMEEAATLPCAALTAWNGLVESANPLAPGATVLTLGTGGVSVFATQFAKAIGFPVLESGSRPRERSLSMAQR